METLTANQARQRIASLKLNPKDYGIASWNDGNYQIYANALNVKIGGANNINKILAYPGGSTDPVTKQILTQEKTQQAAASYTKDNAIAEVQAAAKQYYNSLYSPFYSTALTPAGRQQAQATLDTTIKNVFAKAQQYGVSADEFNSIFSNTISSEQTSQIQQYEKLNADRGGLLGFLDKATPIVTNIAAGVITGGLSLPQQITANALIQAAQGANPTDIVRNVTATVAANSLTQGVPGVESSKEIPKILSQVNKAIADAGPKAVSETLKSALINAERQAVAALITKQDVVQNALAGAAGGTIADLVGVGLAKLSPSMREATIQSLSRAAAEYSQYKTAGFSDEEALVKATNGYLAEQQKIESAAAKAKQQTAGLSAEQVGVAQQYGQTAGFASGQAGQYTGLDASGKSLSPVEVIGTGTVDQPAGAGLSLTSTATPGARRTSATEARSLAPVTVYGQIEKIEPEELSLTSTQPAVAEEEAQPKEQTPEQLRQNMILTSLINRNVTSPLYSSKAKTVAKEAGTPGTAALAQALRVGDVGAPIFGRDEEGRRAGWNLQSLRYMGDVGAEND
jgi:hypothetical protein